MRAWALNLDWVARDLNLQNTTKVTLNKAVVRPIHPKAQTRSSLS